jgi:hypothetical protein
MIWNKIPDAFDEGMAGDSEVKAAQLTKDHKAIALKAVAPQPRPYARAPWHNLRTPLPRRGHSLPSARATACASERREEHHCVTEWLGGGDHGGVSTPLDAQERERIEKAGGFVEDGRVNAMLEVSRAFGLPMRSTGTSVGVVGLGV